MKYIIIILFAIVLRGDQDSLKVDTIKVDTLKNRTFVQQQQMNNDVDSIRYHLKSIKLKLDSLHNSENDTIK